MRRLKGGIKKLDDEDSGKNDRQNNTGRRKGGAWGTTFYSSASDTENSEGKMEIERLELNRGHSRHIKENELRNLQERTRGFKP
jgi:hypothetical protein